MGFLHQLFDAPTMTAGMIWQADRSLVLGFSISARLQTTLSSDDRRRALGADRPHAIALATIAGAASSRCFYASAAVMRTLFKKGAALPRRSRFSSRPPNRARAAGLLGWQLMLAHGPEASSLSRS